MTTRELMVWVPRVVAVGVTLFIAAIAMDSIAVISGPLLIVGALFLWRWRASRVT